MHVSFSDWNSNASTAAPAWRRTFRLRTRLGVAFGLAGLLGGFAGCQTRHYPAGFLGTITGEGQVDAAYIGELATLTATAADGWRFDHWQGPGDYSTENPHTVGAVRVPYYTAVFIAEDVNTNGNANDNGDTNTNGDVSTNGDADVASNGS